VLIVIRCAPSQGVGPDLSGDDPALVGGVEEHLGADLIGNLAHLCHRMGEKVQAAADRDDLRANRMGKVAERSKINGIAVGVDGGGVGGETVEPGATGGVVGDMAADAAGAVR
jgi:hypothetical protein